MKNQTAWPALLLVLLPLASAYPTHAQTCFDTLAYYQQTNDTSRYYTYLDQKAKMAATILKDSLLFHKLISFIDPDPGSINPKKRVWLRKVYTRFGWGYLYHLVDYSKAEKYYLLAYQYAEDSILLDKHAWFVENELMNLYNRLDEYEKAEYFLNLTQGSLIHQAEKDGNQHRAKEYYSRLYVNIGRLEESKGENEKAMAAYQRGLALADEVNTEKGIQGNAISLAHLAIEIDSMELAREMIRIAASAMDSLHHERDYKERLANVTSAEAKYCFKKALANHDTTDAAACMPMFRQATDTLKAYLGYRPSREAAKYLVEYADALLDIDSPDAASQVLAEALNNILGWPQHGEEMPPQEILYRENTFIQVFESYARLFKQRYHHTKDHRYLTDEIAALDNAIYVNDLILNQVAADPSKLVAIRTNKRLVHEQLNTVYQLYTLSHDDEYLSRARTLFNRSKSLLLDEKIRQQESIAELTDEERAYLRKWQFELKAAHEMKLDRRLDGDSLSRVIYLLEQKIDGLLDSPVQSSHLKTVVGDYIEYAAYEKEIFVLADVSGTIRFVRLPEELDIKSLLERLNIFIEQRGLSEDTTIQHDLYRALITPLTVQIPSRITILPDGVISYIPFDLLVDDQGRMLIEYTTIHYAYQYQSIEKRKPKIQPTFEVCCLAPSYAAVEETREMATRGSLNPLPYAGLEADSIQRLYGHRAFRSTAQHDTQLLDSLALARVFHFSGHAIVSKHDAYLALGSNDDPTSKLTVDELSQLANGPELVVLSACETGLGSLDTGEGVRSLGRSFAEAGAEAIVFSLWNVFDASTSQLMILFHLGLKAGQTVDEALRNAKLEYIAKSDEDMQHPYFWAGFVCTE